MAVIFQFVFLLGQLLGRQVAVEIDSAQQGEHQGHAEQAEHLEVDPHLLRQVEGHIEVEQAADGEEADPAEIDPIPDGIRRLQLLAQHLLDQVLAKAVAADEQAQREQYVDDGHFPFDEGVVVEDDGQAAKEADQQEGEQLHLLDLAIANPAVGELQTGHHHQGAGGHVDVVELVDRKENDKGNKFNKLLHVWLVALKSGTQNFIQCTCPMGNGK